MFNIMFTGFLGAFFANIANLFILKYGVENTSDIFKIALYILPIQYFIAVTYTYYYTNGYQTSFSYPALLILSYSFGMIISVCLHFIFLKKIINIYDILGIIIIFIGIGLMTYGKGK